LPISRLPARRAASCGGAHLAVANCGAGYASLSRVRDVPFCELKIDRSYVANCGSDPVNAGLCETIIELAHGFGIPAVAEGIETSAELQALLRMGCDAGQGFLFARPMAKDHFLEEIRKRT